jgi:sugar/nucleoside kinase (ribokinase family)
MAPLAHDVLVLGDVNPDLVLTGDVVPRFGQAEQLLTGADLLIGGSGAITAHGMARLGLDVALLSEVGDDVFGRLMLERLAAAGVRTELIRRTTERATGLSVVLSAAESRSTLTYLGAIDADPPSWHQVEDLPRARHLHVTSYYLQRRLAAALPRLLRLARGAGMTISLDTNLDPDGAFTGIGDVLALVDLTFPNAAEALGMATAVGRPTTDLVEAGIALAACGPTVVVKNSADGALLVRPDGSVLQVDGRAVAPVDTTGAGDTFAAAFLSARLLGHPDTTAMAWADAAGRLATQALGGTAAQPTLPLLLAALP